MDHRDLLSIKDLTRKDVGIIFDKARENMNADPVKSLAGKSVVLVFEKASTRTRISFEVGIARLGGHPVILAKEGSQMARGEPLKDTARILSGYCDCIVMRTFEHTRLEEMAKWADIPVINALTDLLHPCQVLADCFTLDLRFGPLADKKIAWIGDGNNMAHSWINASTILGFELALSCPQGYEPDKTILDEAVKQGAKISLADDPYKAAAGSIAVNTDVWASMGQEGEATERKDVFKDFQVDSSLMSSAHRDAVFMHCLPAHRGEEVTDDIIEGPRSIVWEQARNRLYVQEAVLDFIMNTVRG